MLSAKHIRVLGRQATILCSKFKLTHSPPSSVVRCSRLSALISVVCITEAHIPWRAPQNTAQLAQSDQGTGLDERCKRWAKTYQCPLRSRRDQWHVQVRLTATVRAPKPLDGYFEWKAIRGEKTKQPYAIAMKPFALAAIWDSWRDAKGCSIGRSPSSPARRMT